MKLYGLIVLAGYLSLVTQAIPLFNLDDEINDILDPSGEDGHSEGPSSQRAQDSDGEWDVIIVGGGTAGIVVADRFSEAGKKTLLLELGGPSYGITGGRERPGWLNNTELSRVDVPGLYKSIFMGGSSLQCKPDVVAAFQGCTIGGNSAINAGLFFQPPASDWDNYHPEGWKDKDVAPATQRLLQRQSSVVNYSQDHKYYLQTGFEAARKWIVEDASFTEVSINDEPANKEKVFGRPVYDYNGGQRGGPVTTYLQSALKRSNFTLQTGVQVQYIERNGQVAIGVVAKSGDVTVKFKLSGAGRVVLSTGAIISPSILYKSGIGPEDVLVNYSKADSAAYKDRSSWILSDAVGKGLFDNPNTFIELSAPTIQSYVYNYTDPIPSDRDLYLNSRSGPYTFASQTSAFWSYVNNTDGSRTGIQGTIDSAGYGDYTDNNTITLNIYGTSGMASSGSVILSSDGNYTPGPDGKVYYSDPRDSHAIASFIFDIFQALPSSSPKNPAKDGLTPLNIPRSSTLADIEKYITTPSAYAVGSVQHWTSSCRIGTCVDQNAQVIGTQNIHVVDASIISPVTVNPQFAVMVAAEHASEKILAL